MNRGLKPPPLLLGAALVFWGWQSSFFVAGGIMAVILESAHLVKARWEFTDKDFARIWTFCSVLFLGAAIYAFTDSGGPGEFKGLIQNPNLLTERNAGTATARTTAAVFRWLPMVFFLLMAVQSYSTRQGVPLETVSLILQRRWKKAALAGEPLPPTRVLDISYIYFALCLFSASVHLAEDSTFFWGVCALLGWALWTQRSRRYGLVIWGAALLSAICVGYFSQNAIGHLQGYLGNLNPQWLSNWTRRRFDPARTRTDIGRIGRMKASSRIVIRLEARKGAPPSLLREASYRTYKSQTWLADIAEKEFDELRSETNETSYVLVPGKSNTVSVSIGAYLDGGKALLPLPEGSARIDDLMVISLKRNTLGAVLAEGPGLALFDASYGPGATQDSGPTESEDLAVPQREEAAIDQIVQQLELTNKPAEQVARKLTAFFQEHFNYSTWQEPPRTVRTNDTPLGRFLLQTHAGHCEYFATAGVLLLRRSGIPARYTVGYAVHEGTGHKYVIRQRDAHAWCLYWDKSASLWRELDLTPASWLATENLRASKLQFLGDWWSRIVYEFSRFRWGRTNIRQYLLWALIPILAALLYRIVFRSRRRRKHGAAAAAALARDWPGLDSEFYLFEKKLAGQGTPRDPSEPISDWLERALENPALADLREPLHDLLRLHYKYRFDPEGLSREERQQLRRAAAECVARIEQRPQPSR